MTPTKEEFTIQNSKMHEITIHHELMETQQK